MGKKKKPVPSDENKSARSGEYRASWNFSDRVTPNVRKPSVVIVAKYK
jgi:hypothetical protein